MHWIANLSWCRTCDEDFLQVSVISAAVVNSYLVCFFKFGSDIRRVVAYNSTTENYKNYKQLSVSGSDRNGSKKTEKESVK